MKRQNRIFSVLFAASTAMFVACGGGSSDSKDGDSAEKKDGEEKGDAKGGDGDGGAAKPEVKKKEFKKFGDGEAPIEMSEWGFKAEKNFLGPEGSKNLKGTFKVKSVKKVEQGMMMTIKSTCKLGDEYLADSSSPMALFTYVEPGESMRVSGSSYPMKGVASDPSQCDLTFMLKGLFDDGGDSFGDYCFKDGALNEGKCG